MILILIDFIKTQFNIKLPIVFSFTSTRMMLAALTSLLLSIFLGPYFIRKLYSLKIGQPIRKEECPLLGKLHEKKENTPTMGGILILASMLLSLFLWMDLSCPYTLILLITTITLGALGGRDDFLKLKYKNSKGLSAKKKLAIQFLLSLLISSYLLFPALTQSLHFHNWYKPPVVKENVHYNGDENIHIQSQQFTLREFTLQLYVPFFKDPVFALSGILGTSLMMFLIFLVVTGSSNAVNLTDGLDGLAAGTVIMVAATFSCVAFFSNHVNLARYLNIAYIEGSGEIAIYLSAVCGACLGFLWYNGYPAQVFMGDIGSLTLGGIIGVSAILLKRELLLVIVGGIFVAETLSVIIQVISFRFFNKKRIFLCSPLHHHFEYKNWPENKVTLRFWIVGLFLALIGLASLKFQ